MIVDTLFNAAFNMGNIDLLRKKLAGAAITDRIILVYSGHGKLEGGKYYFPVSSMNTADFKNPAAKAISYEVIEDLLNSTPARNKLFLIDACHSGTYDANAEEVMTNITTSQIMEELFTYVGNGTGATIVASSSADSRSLESPQFKHGFFTQGILNALKEFKTITAGQLQHYILEQVPVISNFAQRPVVRSENREMNFNIW